MKFRIGLLVAGFLWLNIFLFLGEVHTGQDPALVISRMFMGCVLAAGVLYLVRARDRRKQEVPNDSQ